MTISNTNSETSAVDDTVLKAASVVRIVDDDEAMRRS